MSTLLPKIRTNRGNVGNDIWVHLPDLSSFPTTNLSADEASGQTVLSVLQGEANVDYVIIGIPGTEQAEIRLVSSSAAGTITVSSATDYAHVQGTLVTFIPYNQIELSSATSSGGSFSVLSTSNIRPDSTETYFNRPADANTVYYKARFKDESDTTYSDYSDEVAATGFADNSVYMIKKRALDQLGEMLGGIITDEYLNDSLWEGRREIDRKFKRWSWRTSFNTDIGNATEGAYSVAVPSTLRNPDSSQNILGLRMGNRGRNISYIGKREFDSYYEGIVHTTIATQPTVGQTTLVLASCRDLDDSGTIVVGANTITYTSKTDSTGTLAGVPASGDGSIDATHAVGVDVWQGASFGEPTAYTIFEDTIFFNQPFSSDFEGANIISDFYRNLPSKDSDADIVDEPDYDALTSYVKMKVKEKKAKGKFNKKEDSDYLDFLTRVSDMMRKETLGQDVGFVPDISHLIDEE